MKRSLLRLALLIGSGALVLQTTGCLDPTLLSNSLRTALLLDLLTAGTAT
jgi:hypothetical protein